MVHEKVRRLAPASRLSRRRPRYLGPVVGFALVALGAVASGHPHATPPPIEVQLSVEGTGLTVRVRLDEALARLLLASGQEEQRPTDEQLVHWLAKVVTITSDGEAVDLVAAAPKPLDAVPARGGFPAQPAAFLLTSSAVLASTPRSFGVAWLDFTSIDWEGEVQVPATLDADGNMVTALLTPIEPEVTWHAPAVPRKERPAPTPVVAPPPPERHVPVSGPLLLALGLLVAVMLRGPHGRRRWAWGVVVAAAAWPLWGTIHVTLPGVSRPLLAGPKQATEVFGRLHENVYAAFDAASEDEIYDRLAVSVDASLLDTLYRHVYEMFVMRDQGGAVSRLESLEVVERSVSLPEDPAVPSFEAVWSWHVVGRVTHWGHTHRRRNELKARFQVAFEKGTWKIRDMEVLEHRRVDL